MRAAALGALGALAVVAALAAQQAPAPFRGAVDIVALDVQVVDKDGAPIVNLPPAKFTVTLGGKSRKVVSADLITSETKEITVGRAAGAAPAASAAMTTGAGLSADPRRVYIIAIDAMSFQPVEVAPAKEAIRAFVERLGPDDLVALMTFPLGPTVRASTNRQQLLAALEQVVGQEDPEAVDVAQMSPSMLVDITRADISDLNRDVEILRRSEPMLINRVFAMCTDAPERIFCLQNIFLQGRAAAQSREAQAKVRLASLRNLLTSMKGASMHKVVVLVSGGIMSADRDGGRPALGDVGRQVGQAAAEANAAIYTLFYDQLSGERAALARRARRATDGPRDSAILSRPLQQIADASGGAFLSIPQGNGEFAFDRILKETTAYYLLGVEPDPKDRDGKAKELRVKVDAPGATVRGRAWVLLPKSAETPKK